MDKTKILLERAHNTYYPENASIYVTMLYVAEERSLPDGVSSTYPSLAVRLPQQYTFLYSPPIY
jgi:hypothetical protein